MIPNQRHTLGAWALALGYAGFIFALSSCSKPLDFLGDQQYRLPDWVLHGLEYGVFGFLLMRATLLSLKSRATLLLVAYVVFFGIIYALSDEWHQSFVPFRDCSWWDVFSDTVGLCVGVGLRVGVNVFIKAKERT